MYQLKKLFLSALLGASVVLGPAPASAPEEVTIPNSFPAKMHYCSCKLINSNFLIVGMLRLQLNRARLRQRRLIGSFGKHLILVGVNLIQRTPQITIESILMEAVQSLQTNIEKYFSI